MSNKARLHKKEFRAMGTDVSIEIMANAENEANQAETAIENVLNIFLGLEKKFSRFDPESELSRINKNIGQEIPVSSEMSEILELCFKYCEESKGYFDPRVIDCLEEIGYTRDFRSHDPNSEKEACVTFSQIKEKLGNELIINEKKKTILAKRRIDTTGIVKGYAVDQAVKYLKSEGFENFIVDAGGDMYAEGSSEGGKDWKVCVEGAEKCELMLKLKGEGIATSGISRKRWTRGNQKFHHLINPKDPQNFSFELKTVTVIKEKTVEADGKAKVLFLMGLQDGMKFANANKLKALFLDYKGNVYLSEAIQENVVK